MTSSNQVAIDKRIEIIASKCYEANKAYCESIGDTSQVSWAEATQSQRMSSISGVYWRLSNLNAPAGAQHDKWMADKLAEGWVYGEVKDEVKKTHHCLIPYDQLPEVQRKKDDIFVDTVKKMIKKTFTLGEFRVGIYFNVGGHPAVDSIKRAAANQIDYLESQKKLVDKSSPLAGEIFRLLAHAQTLTEDAAMNGVKAVTKDIVDVTLFEY